MTTFSFLTTPTDIQVMQLLSLYEAAGWWEPEPDAPSQLLRLVTGSHCFLVAEEEGSVVGMGRAISDGVSDGYIQDVTVKSEFKHRGIGTEIVLRITNRLLKDGLSWVGLIAERNSHAFYRRIGFTEMPQAVPMRFEK